MNPSFLLELDSPPIRRRQRWFARLRQAAKWTWQALLFDPLWFLQRPGRDRAELGSSIFARLARGLLYRLMGIPFMVAAIAAVMVFNGTHPPLSAQAADPQSVGVYYDPVSFMADDGTRLEGWLVPVVDAQRVLHEKEGVIREQSPAAILVHDFGATAEQMLPLIRPLHNAGFVVLVVSLRGSDSRTPAGQTFGLRESGDVRAAIDVLHKRPNIDQHRIAIVGEGTGATAALLAAQDDSSIAALVLDHPITRTDDLISRIGPGQWWLLWMRPMCKWTFDFAYNVDANDVDMYHLQSTMQSRPCLLMDQGSHGLNRQATEHLTDFLTKKLKPAG
ncbi:MAG TPA: dienelactone hydrolase family protein [Tepidisphaeraceae bacterium]|jgi:dienelactone hydrolase|nr:dienelactone hydrolase family protein [Tepidisphaeraceae bacterium]